MTEAKLDSGQKVEDLEAIVTGNLMALKEDVSECLKASGKVSLGAGEKNPC